MNGDYNAADFALFVNGRVIRQFTGADGFILSGDTTFNSGPSGHAWGFNDQLSENAAEGTLNVRQTSPDLGYLLRKARGEDGRKEDLKITVKAVRNLDKYQAGDIIGFSAARCRIRPDDHQFGTEEEAQDVTFQVLAIGLDYLEAEGGAEGPEE